MVFLYLWGHFKADGGMGKINTYVYTTLLKVVFLFFFSRRHANHANVIFKIYPEYISHYLHLGHVTLVSLQDRCRQTTEQSIRLFEHANQVLSKFSSGFPSLPTFIKHFCHIYFASLWTIWKWVGNMILIPKYSRMLSWH